MKQLSPQQLARWRRDPCGFIETQLVDPVTNKPFVLLPAERAFIEHAFQIDEETGRLRYPEMAYATQGRQDRLRRDDDADDDAAAAWRNQKPARTCMPAAEY